MSAMSVHPHRSRLQVCSNLIRRVATHLAMGDVSGRPSRNDPFASFLVGVLASAGVTVTVDLNVSCFARRDYLTSGYPSILDETSFSFALFESGREPTLKVRGSGFAEKGRASRSKEVRRTDWKATLPRCR